MEDRMARALSYIARVRVRRRLGLAARLLAAAAVGAALVLALAK